MKRAMLVFALVPLSGCLFCYTPGHQVAKLPEDWRSGAELQSFSSFKSHAGGGQDDLYHNSSRPIEAPTSCIAYRGASQYSKDTCHVVGRPVTPSGGTTYGPWTIHGEWAAGDCDADRTRGDKVVAFDASGRIVAFWDGDHDPGGSHATE